MACGGDGLVSQVASALAGRDLPMAIVPAGRGNDVARALGVPLSLPLAARAAAEGVSVSYELITVDDLTSSDGAWLLSSGRLVAPILRLDDVQLASDPVFTERVWGWATGPS